MSSTIFDPAMLTASPTPSPEPEEHPQHEGNTSLNDATLDDVSPKEPQESNVDQIEQSWAAVLNTMRIYVKMCPPLKPQLLEEQESDSDAVELAEGKVAAKALTKAVQAWKEKVAESAVTAHPACAKKEKIAEEPKATEKGKGKEVVGAIESTEKATEDSTSPVVVDMGRPVSFYFFFLDSVYADAL
ncbi:uncharacterized protein HD556DRAFT_1438208 [Suillus plorans]|uniref:Uncharacterized protein n=1 Tax=Suillus plorans TaxID=116603 RepID=A0A9P7DT11_9AGAM|nr:uncharacterized protein HD556DRAFT_1438208 [Suillus plorans]KAG1802173.1 hypothetical protein HD556DRAFT_1438208 [Suillus plorans]